MNEHKTILIVESESEEVDLLTQLLRDDYQLQVASNGEQALDILRSTAPDLIMLSAKPDADTCQLCKTLKSSSQTGDTPVIIISSSNDNASLEKALESGADDFIIKPVSPSLVKLRITNLLRLAHDTQEFNRVKHQIGESHYEQNQLLSAISSILIGLNQHGCITLWNRSAENVFSLLSKDTRGKRLDELGLTWDQATINTAIDDCRSNIHIVRTDDIPYTRADGSNGFLGFNLTPIMHRDNNKLGVLIIGADITEKKDLEKQLLQAQKLESIGQLAAGIAHEINTPVQFVGSNLSFLSDSFVEITEMLEGIKQLIESAGESTASTGLPEKIAALMKKADIDYLIEDFPNAIGQSQEGVSRVSKIVQAMKDFSHGNDEKSEADLNRAIESTITVAQSEWKHVATMNTELDPDLPLVPCLLGEFNQVILNMIVNASHAITDAISGITGGMGTITITTKKQGDWAEIRVSDTGTGMPEEIKNRIFDPFFTTKEVGKGTGQGLSIAHSVVAQKHGGSIAVESTPGEGTTFIILLPLHAA